MEQHVKRGPRLVMVWKRPRTPRVEHIIGLAAREAESLGHSKVGTGHLLLGVLGDWSCAAAAVLAELGVDFGILRERVLREIGDAESGEPRGVGNERGEQG